MMLSLPIFRISSVLAPLYKGHIVSTWVTVCDLHPHPHPGLISGTLMAASHEFSPITSVLNRNRAVAWCFGRSEYSSRVFCCHRALHVIASFPSAVFFHLFLHSTLAHLSICDAGPRVASGRPSRRLLGPLPGWARLSIRVALASICSALCSTISALVRGLGPICLGLPLCLLFCGVFSASPQSSSSIMGGWNCKVASLALFSLAFNRALTRRITLA
jgi:hypothetical protein